MTNWTKALQAVIAGEPDVIPKGWYSVEQVMKQFGKGRSWTRKALGKLVKAGGAERKLFRVPKKNSRRVPVPYFRLR